MASALRRSLITLALQQIRMSPPPSVFSSSITSAAGAFAIRTSSQGDAVSVEDSTT